MIIQEVKKTPRDFLILAVIFLLGLLAYWPSLHNAGAQQLVVIFTGTSYFLWGIFHHWHEGDLCFKIIWEYLFLAVFATTTALFLVLRQ